MKKAILMTAVMAFICSCSAQSNGGGSAFPKDPNVTKDNCVSAGGVVDVPPAETVMDKCCEDLAPALFRSPQDGSTGYRHYRCIYANKCTEDGGAVEYANYISCCSGLVIMDEKCVAKEKCSAAAGQILVSAPLDQKKCIAFPACVKSGPIDKFICEYCCAGSKYTIQMITGLPPEKCLGPDESLSEEQINYGWTEPRLVTQEEYDNFKSECGGEHRP